MKTIRLALLSVFLLLICSPLLASGTVGIYAVVERVVFQPNEEAPERIQVFGTFAYQDNTRGAASGFTTPKRGFMYFRLPEGASRSTVQREWEDIASVAGTGEAIAFGHFGYAGQVPTATDGAGSNFSLGVNMGVRLAVDAPAANPSTAATYNPSGVGVVRLSDGNHAEIAAQLRERLTRD
jgi:hypothetical protein